MAGLVLGWKFWRIYMFGPWVSQVGKIGPWISKIGNYQKWSLYYYTMASLVPCEYFGNNTNQVPKLQIIYILVLVISKLPIPNLLLLLQNKTKSNTPTWSSPPHHPSPPQKAHPRFYYKHQGQRLGSNPPFPPKPPSPTSNTTCKTTLIPCHSPN